MTVIFTQTDYTANFTTTQRTISDFNLGSVAGGLLILFLNGMKKSHVSITNTNFYAGNIIPDTNQVGGSGIAIHSFNCGKCSSGTLDHPWLHPIYLDTVYIKGESQISKHKYVSTFYMDIHESCTNDFKQFFLRKLNFTIGFYNHFQPGMYAVVRSPKANHSIVLESCKTTQCSSNTASLYSQVACSNDICQLEKCYHMWRKLLSKSNPVSVQH